MVLLLHMFVCEQIERDKVRKCAVETKQAIKNHQKSDEALKILVDKHEETVYMLEKMSSEKERLKNELWVCQKKDETARADFEEQVSHFSPTLFLPDFIPLKSLVVRCRENSDRHVLGCVGTDSSR